MGDDEETPAQRARRWLSASAGYTKPTTFERFLIDTASSYASDVLTLSTERDQLAEECMRHQVGESYQLGHEHGSAVAARYKAERDEAVHSADMERLAYMAADAEARRLRRELDGLAEIAEAPDA